MSQIQNANFSGAVVFNLVILIVFGLIWIGLVRSLRSRKSPAWLIFFTIFYIYLFKVLDYTLFQFQSLIVLQVFGSNLILNGQTAEKAVNLIPLIMLTRQDLSTSLLNILLLVPFGFGLPFVTDFRMKKVVLAGALFSLLIEFLQWITGVMAKMTFRIADVNDVIFNTLGAAIGYILFVSFVRIYRRISGNGAISSNPILRYVAERPQVDR